MYFGMFNVREGIYHFKVTFKVTIMRFPQCATCCQKQQETYAPIHLWNGP